MTPAAKAPGGTGDCREHGCCIGRFGLAQNGGPTGQRELDAAIEGALAHGGSDLGNTVDEVASGVLYIHPALTEVIEQTLLKL
jgi:hypothetical protein